MCSPITASTSAEALGKPYKPVIFSARKYLCIPQKVILRLNGYNRHENSLKMQFKEILIFTWLLEPETWLLSSDTSFSNYSQILPPLDIQSFWYMCCWIEHNIQSFCNAFWPLYPFSTIFLDATFFVKDFPIPSSELGTPMYLHSTSCLPIIALITAV